MNRYSVEVWSVGSCPIGPGSGFPLFEYSQVRSIHNTIFIARRGIEIWDK